ncbi:MAG: GW dipeptide domain-containing protein [Balneolaceae bacterium]
MKHLIFFLFTLLLIVLPGSSIAQQARFDEATDLLEEQQFMEAIHQYKSISEDGYVSGALWLNIGVAYAQLDSLGKAKYYLMRAREFNETRQSASQSLDLIENRFSRRSAVLPMLPWDRFFNWMEQIMGVSGLMITGLILLNGAALLLLISWFRPRFSKIFNRLAAGTLAFSIFFAGISIYLNLQDEWYDTGVTVSGQAQVFNQPDAESAVVSTAYEGYTMRVHNNRQADSEKWAYVRLANGLYGWIDRQAIMTF